MNDDLGDRMKEYESLPASRLMRKMPVIIRMDGKAFHTITRGMEKPYDKSLSHCMHEAAKYVCSNIQGAKVAYVQSDEISILIMDNQSLKADSWFNYELPKMLSISAAMASVAFFKEALKIDLKINNLPVFDSRAWNLPEHEVANYFIWRQKDATRNSINSLGQAHFSHKQLQNKNIDEVQDMLFKEKGINWNDCPIEQKRGVCVYKTSVLGEGFNPKTQEKVPAIRHEWVVDYNIPVFTQDRDYIEKYLKPSAKED